MEEAVLHIAPLDLNADVVAVVCVAAEPSTAVRAEVACPANTSRIDPRPSMHGINVVWALVGSIVALAIIASDDDRIVTRFVLSVIRTFFFFFFPRGENDTFLQLCGEGVWVDPEVQSPRIASKRVERSPTGFSLKVPASVL